MRTSHLRSSSRWTYLFILAVLPISLCFCNRYSTTGYASAQDEPKGNEPKEALSVETARDRAKLMHKLYVITMDVMHDRYFHNDRAVVPARAMEDVFTQFKRETGAESRWISVNTEPMSVSHEPKTDFEKTAAKELAAGKADYEVVEDGVYRRATPIRFTEGCIACHVGFFKEPPKTPKYAGLIISMPLKEQPSEK